MPVAPRPAAQLLLDDVARRVADWDLAPTAALRVLFHGMALARSGALPTPEALDARLASDPAWGLAPVTLAPRTLEDTATALTALGRDALATLPEELLGALHERRLAGTDRARRKHGGVHYTPEDVVAHLVDATLGEALAQGEVRSVLDPACGGGAFLLAALRRLVATGVPGRVALSRMAGVDVDVEAVDVTRMALLLASGARSDGGPPIDLGSIVVSGNALLDPGVLSPARLAELEAIDPSWTRPLAWSTAFPTQHAEGGFDVVLANPPYVSYAGREGASLPDVIRKTVVPRFASRRWPSLHGMFVERAVRLAHPTRGRVGLVLPDQVGHLAGYEPVRAVAAEAGITEVRYWGEDVFDAVTPVLTLVLHRGHTGDARAVDARGATSELPRLSGSSTWRRSPLSALLGRVRVPVTSLGARVGDCGVRTSKGTERLVLPRQHATPDAVPVLEGKDVTRYACRLPEKVLRLAPLPDTAFFRARDERYARATFVIRQTAGYPIVGPRRHATLFRNSLLALYPPEDGTSPLFAVGVLNTDLMRAMYEALVHEAGQRVFPQVKLRALRALPFAAPRLDDPQQRASHDRIVSLVEQRLSEPDGAATDLERSIETSVCELYGLTADEVRRA